MRPRSSRRVDPYLWDWQVATQKMLNDYLPVQGLNNLKIIYFDSNLHYDLPIHYTCLNSQLARFVPIFRRNLSTRISGILRVRSTPIEDARRPGWEVRVEWILTYGTNKWQYENCYMTTRRLEP